MILHNFELILPNYIKRLWEVTAFPTNQKQPLRTKIFLQVPSFPQTNNSFTAPTSFLSLFPNVLNILFQRSLLTKENDL